MSAVREGEGEGTSVRPGGRLPAIRVQVYGGVPLFPVKVDVYGWNCVPFGGLPEILSGGALFATFTMPIRKQNEIMSALI